MGQPDRQDFIYLASASPRRAQLLAQIHVRHELLVPGADEDAEALEAERPGELPLDYVLRVTRAKLGAALQRRLRRGLPPAPVLCADTTVALDQRIFGKPRDAAQARATLLALSGRKHQVITAVALSWDLESACVASISDVVFAPVAASDIDAYVASGEPFGKAGAYAIQSGAAAWISRIEGSYSAIMGLPLHETAELLRRARVRAAPPTP